MQVQQKVFIANITTQVIERHVVGKLENIFNPVAFSKLSDKQVQAIASEPPQSKRVREFLEDRIAKLENGHEIFKGVMGSIVK